MDCAGLGLLVTEEGHAVRGRALGPCERAHCLLDLGEEIAVLGDLARGTEGR